MTKIFSLLAVSAFLCITASAQKSVNEVPKNWYQLDKDSSGFYGISLNRAYSFLKAKKVKSRQVVVAVIDSGVDTAHEDLKPILWTNAKEIPGNGIDDDKNGYIDDVHGWNFLGGKDGRNIKENSLEAARVYYKLKTKYGSVIPDESSISPEEKEEVEMYKRAQQKVLGDVNPFEISLYKKILPDFLNGDSVIAKELGKESYDCNDLQAYKPTNPDAKGTKALLMQLCKDNSNELTNREVIDQIQGMIRKADAANNPPREYRKEIVQDDPTNINDRNYGNNDIMAATSLHGTHCSGIIAAVRNNGKGMDGIADNVRIMMVRAVADGDEYDKDVANAIRYAVDNGAQIISMSFGKEFSPEKKWVDDAVKYAEQKGVLLVHASGNESANIDSAYNFPTATALDGKTKASNWIEVSASGDPKNGGTTAYFSNYGKKNVDIFAPGVQIYSTLPGGNKYGNESGTSMACPVVAGTAALILEYFPNLSARQIKYAIEKSATAPVEEVKIPGTTDMVKLTELCKTGGLLNAYGAIKIASTLKGERNNSRKNEVLPKPILKKNKKG